MENASKALIIAGAILLSILIIAIGMYVYTNAQSTVNESLTAMSEQEVKAFNSKFIGYEGNATGSQLKALIGDLIATSSNYAEEPAKIVSIRFDKLKEAGTADVEIPKPEKANTTQGYVTDLGKARNLVENKHTYWVELVYDGPSGLIHTINVSYQKNDYENGATYKVGEKLEPKDYTE